MRRFTTLFIFSTLLISSSLFAQTVEFDWNIAPDSTFAAPYTAGGQSGSRAVVGPADLDGDGLMEVFVSDYTAGGRVHVFENVSVGTWEMIYSTPAYDATNSSGNVRGIGVGDMDGDGNGEIIVTQGRNLINTDATAVPGIYVYESNGDNSFADASVWDYGDDIHDRWVAEQLTVTDVDGDGLDELLFGNNGGDNAFDRWDIVGVTDDIGSGFETFQLEASWTTRNIDDDTIMDAVDRGGGSAYGMIPADLNGDGMMNISMHSWNNYNFTNAWVAGVNSYEAPGDGDSNISFKASDSDHVALFGCSAGDLNGDGDDEVVCPNLFTRSCSVVNYEAGENVQEVTSDNVAFDLIENCSAHGSAIGDMDGDGRLEVIGSGSSWISDNPATGGMVLSINEFVGTDPESAASYERTELLIPRSGINTSTTSRDSAGVDIGPLVSGDGVFASKVIYLGDVDGDGFRSIATSFQGVVDYTEIATVFEPSDSTYTVLSSVPNLERSFLTIISSDGLQVSNETIILPSDYKLSGNYPNPFNPTTSFSFTLPIEKSVSVKVYDVSGRLVQTILNNEFRNAGTYQASWDGKDASGNSVVSGTYFYTLEYGNFRQSKSMILLK